jgi:hypothetical protein
MTVPRKRKPAAPLTPAQIEAARAQAERHRVKLATVIAEWAERGRVDP